MVTIANDNRGFLIAIVIVLALAVFSGGIRDNYSTGYAGLSADPGAAGHESYSSDQSANKMALEDCLDIARRTRDYRRSGLCYNTYLEGQEATKNRYGR